MREIRSDDRTTMNALDVDECLVLLRWENIGRLAFSTHGEAPVIVPINFTMHEGEIFFRSTDGLKLDRVREQPVSLEVDRFDQYRRIGWSVLVRGVAHEADASALPDLDIDPWAPGHLSHLVRIVPAAISGRRLELVNVSDRRGDL